MYKSVVLLLLLAGVAAVVPAPARAIVSPSGVEWMDHRVLVLLSDDLGSAEFMFSAKAGGRTGLDRPWTAEQWQNVADAIRGHIDGLGVPFSLTLYTVASYVEPDFTLVSGDSTEVVVSPFTLSAPGWSPYGIEPPEIASAQSVSSPTAMFFSTTSVASDGWANHPVAECKEYEVRFWVRPQTVTEATHLVSVGGPLGRGMGIIASSTDGLLYLREVYGNDERKTPIGAYTLDAWQSITFRSVAGQVQVDLGSDGTVELAKPAAMLPTLTNTLVVGDFSTSAYSGEAWVDDVVFTRYDNVYPLDPVITPLDVKFPEVVATINANRDVLRVQSHGLTHANDAEIQRRYARGEIDDRSQGEELWWREFYDAVHDVPFTIGYQAARLQEVRARFQTLFGYAPRVHVSPGNAFGHETDTALAMSGIYFHENRPYGAGAFSLYDPDVFCSSRTIDQELPAGDPVVAAAQAVAQVTEVWDTGTPAILQSHAFNALVDGTGEKLAWFYDAVLGRLTRAYPDIVTLTTYEMAQLERDGCSVSLERGHRIYLRNYLPGAHEFHVPIDPAFEVFVVKRLGNHQVLPHQMAGDELVFEGGEGDYVVLLLDAGSTDVAVDLPGDVTRPALALSPSPARPTTTILAEVPRAGVVTLDLFDARGRHVRRLLREQVSAGPLQVRWDGQAGDGRPVAAGLYFVRMEWAGGSERAKLLVVR